MKFCIIIELLKYLQLKCKILYYDCAIEIYQRSVFFLLRLLIYDCVQKTKEIDIWLCNRSYKHITYKDDKLTRCRKEY